MQTKQQIQLLLQQAGVTPNKRRGQNFLIDLNLMRLLLQSARITKNDVVLEVGCGTGSLTQALAENAGRVIVAEIDRTLAQITEKQLPDNETTLIFNADILHSKNSINADIIEAVSEAKKTFTGRFLLVSNLPYSVACPVMLDLLVSTPAADAMYVTIQKEVADRMTASPSSKDYGPLSISLAVTGQVNTIRTLKPSVFWPQPGVDSAMVSFIRDPQKIAKIHDMNTFRQIVALFMQHRRKMLKACTKFAQDKLEKIHNWDTIFHDCAIDPHARPDQIPPESFLAIANLCCEYLR